MELISDRITRPVSTKSQVQQTFSMRDGELVVFTRDSLKFYNPFSQRLLSSVALPRISMYREFIPYQDLLIGIRATEISLLQVPYNCQLVRRFNGGGKGNWMFQQIGTTCVTWNFGGEIAGAVSHMKQKKPLVENLRHSVKFATDSLWWKEKQVLVILGEGPLQVFSTEDFPANLNLRKKCSFSEQEKFSSVFQMTSAEVLMTHFDMKTKQTSLLCLTKDFSLSKKIALPNQPSVSYSEKQKALLVISPERLEIISKASWTVLTAIELTPDYVHASLQLKPNYPVQLSGATYINLTKEIIIWQRYATIILLLTDLF